MKVVRQQLAPAATLDAALDALSGASAQPGAILRREVVVTEAPALLDWIARQPAGERLYWSDRDGRFAVAGLGFAAKRTLPDGLGGLPRAGLRWFGGLAFDPSRAPSPEWAPFGAGQLVLPWLTLEREGGQVRMALHLVPGGPTGLPEVRTAGSAQSTLVSAGQTFEPDAGGWNGGVRAAVSAIRDGEMRKVVLSRRARVTLVSPPDPFALLARLAGPQVATFDFCFEPAPGWAFLGCSPERLFSRQDRVLHTEALAGTRRRGGDVAADMALGTEMLDSDKEREEHDHVVQSIQSAVTPLCAELSVAEAPRVHRLHRVQHLLTPFEGTLDAGVDEAALLAALHPTPAVCGQPAGAAHAFIQAHEPFHRGWYAGPVGWVGSDGADFAVGIRSALLRGRSLWICAGAGLVAASQPEAEWRELDAKSGQFLSMVEGA